jgi:hypothetical protein
VHRVTSMSDTYIDAVRKQKKTEYDKQYRLKRKLLLPAFTSTETELAEKQKKKAEYDKRYRMSHVLLLCVSVIYFLTCYMYKSSLRHIHDPVLSSLK